MKKLFFVMAAVAALLTSCSKDDTFGGPTRGKVTFEVSTPELATRYGEGTTATTLQYAVYDMVEDATNGKLVDTGTATLDGKHANVSIDLVEGRKYTAIFWADAGENASPYTFTPATKTVSYTNVNNLTANNEAYDAFYAFVPQADIKVGQTVNVTLKRPFAQLRIETSDTVRAQQLGVVVVKTGITVNAYTSFNLETGAVDGKQNITFKPTDKASASTTVGEVTYDLISMNYILANNTNADLVDVTLNFTDDVNGTEESYVRKYSSIDVKRNHRTLVRGTILTDPTQFNVTVSEGFDADISEEHNTSETLVVSTADEIIDAFENLNDDDPDNDPVTIVLGDDINLNDVLIIGSTSTINAKAQNSLSTNAVTRTETETPTIVIDGNGKTISSTATRVIRIQQSNINVEINNLTIEATSDKPGDGNPNNDDGRPDSNRGISIDGYLQNVSLTLNNCNIKFTDDEVGKDWAYAVNVSGNGSGHKVTINGGKYEGANVVNVHGANNIVTVNNATLTSLYADSDMFYGACIWVQEKNNSKVIATGNTFAGDNAIAFNLGEGTELTESDNTDNCYTDIVYISATNSEIKLSNAIAEDTNINLIGNIKLDETLKIAKNITIDLNGKTISGTDTATPSYALIEIQPAAELTIDDSVGTGAIKLTATNNREWDAYSSVISNQRGKLTVNGGTIEHLGGTDMAYAIDNITNTGDQKAKTVINGGTVKSTYRAIRQFLNSTVAENNLTVNGGTIESTGNNKSIWMQNANDKNNPGTLVVKENAVLNSDVLISYSNAANDYISASVAAEALKDGSEVLLSGAPEGYDVFENNGVWTVGKVATIDAQGVYHIADVAGLKWFAAQVNDENTFAGKTVVLDADIDLQNKPWTPIGTKANPFKGTFDGGNYTVSNLKIENLELSYAGLFGYAKGATIKNVKVENVYIKALSQVGSIAGTVYTGTVENCHVSGSIYLYADYAYAGGIASEGYVTVKNCSVIADGTGEITVREKTMAGGITGWRGEGKNNIENCTVKNLDISAFQCVGAISGLVHYENKIDGCVAENVKLTKTRVDGQASIGLAAGCWSNKADNNYTITVTNNTFNNISLNGTALKSKDGVDISQFLQDDQRLIGSNYSSYINIPAANLVVNNNDYNNITDNLEFNE